MEIVNDEDFLYWARDGYATQDVPEPDEDLLKTLMPGRFGLAEAVLVRNRQ